MYPFFITSAVNKIEFSFTGFFEQSSKASNLVELLKCRLREGPVVGKELGLQTARRVTVDIYPQLEKFYLPEKKKQQQFSKSLLGKSHQSDATSGEKAQ